MTRFAERFGPQVAVDFSFVDYIDRTPGGKFRPVISMRGAGRSGAPAVEAPEMNSMRRLVSTVRVAALWFVDSRVPYWPAEKIEGRQNRRVQAIIQHAYDTVPYYRTVMDEMRLKPGNFQTAADLARLPLMNDHDFRKDPARFTSSSVDEKTVLRMFTTGSSGVPKTLLADREAVLSRLVMTARDRAVLSRLLGRSRRQIQLFLFPEASNTFKTQAHWDRNLVGRRMLARRTIFSVDAPFAAVVDKINEVRPHIVFSYGSYADEFFRYVADRKPQVALPKVWMYGGDMMSRQGRAIAEESLGCMVYSTYNAVETGKLGFECERRMGFHLNVDYCAVRLIDESGRDVPPGTTGEIAISNLYNRAMVLLNYRMGDIGVMATAPCPCGRNLPLLAQLTGRKSEFMRFANGSIHYADMLELTFETKISGALQCQLRQLGPSSVVWQIVPASGIDRTALERALLDKSGATFGEGVDVKVEFVEKIDRGPGGKLSRVARS